MKSSKIWGRTVVVAALLLLVVGGTAFAQLQSGNLYGSVVDDKGAALPGVTVTLTGSGAPQVQVTNAQGQFRFLGLPPGTNHLSAQLEGFSSVEYPNISIAVGRNTTIEVTLQPAIEETITVTTESPLLDERKISTGSTVTATELEKIPTARDPWTVLQQVPGVLVDRINVGGDQSGQQSTYVGPGSAGTQAIWAVDGVVITDMGALGSSPAYYDFDAFEEMQVTTGGTDATIATGGVVLNMVTKRGTNEWRGSGRYYDTRQAWQDSTSLDKSDLAAVPGKTPQKSFKRGNRIVEVKDYGAEVGGPIVKDRLWVWGAWGSQRPSLLTVGDVSDKTKLETTNAKLNAQLTANNSATGFYLLGNKSKQGRGAGPTRPQPTTWDQTGPTHVYKAEDTQIFSSNFFLTGLVSYARNGFSLTPEGGLNVTPVLDENFVWHKSFVFYTTDRPTHQYKLDGSNFFNTGSLSHELKYGAGYRKASVTSVSTWAGVGIQLDYYLANYASYGFPNELQLTRAASPAYTVKYKSGYAQDTLTVGNLTANVGVRYDDQSGTNDPRNVAANPVAPTLLPAISFKGGDIGFSWTTITPRLGLTYALGAERKTLLRASYSRFADQLGGGTANFLNPLSVQSYYYFDYTDKNGNGLADPNELTPCTGFHSSCFNAYYNPFSPGQPISSNLVDKNLKPQSTDEVLLSVEHALLPEFVIGLNFTYRKISDVLISNDLIFDGDAFSQANLQNSGRRATANDYVPKTVSGKLPNGQAYSTVVYQLKPGLASRGGFFLYNSRVGQDYRGATFNFNKRLSNRWMLRGNFNVQKWTWDVPKGSLTDPSNYLPGIEDGSPVLQGSTTGTGSRGSVYINSNWSYNINGLYQVAPDHPWGFNLALNATGRQGYPIPYFVKTGRNGFPSQANVVVTKDLDSFRNDAINILDARVEKEFNFKDFGFTLGVDCFNLLNSSTVIQRQSNAALGSVNYVQEIVSPRIFRVGARFSFR
jgi:hypothetical protein